MAVLERSISQRIILSTISIGFLTSILVLVGVLIWYASKISAVSSKIVQTATLGPVKLFTLTKTPLQEGGYQASIQFLSGLLIYACVAIALTSIVAALRINSYQNRKS